METTGDRLKRARLEFAKRTGRYKTPEELADMVGIAHSTQRARENGNREITVQAAKKYTSLLKINLDWLLTGRQEFGEKPSAPGRGLAEKSSAAKRLDPETLAKTIFDLVQQNHPHPAQTYDEIRELQIKCEGLAGMGDTD
jgi:transcriptional regulator with XRE-family HTH domain